MPAPHVAAAIAAFNLICSGTHSHQTLDSKTSEPYNITLRINLDAGMFCRDDCKSPQKIVSIEPTAITLSAIDEDKTEFQTSEKQVINRETGKLVSFMNVQMNHDPATLILDSWNADCTKAPFTGFPSVSTKF